MGTGYVLRVGSEVCWGCVMGGYWVCLMGW